MNAPNTPDLASENAELRARLAEAEDTCAPSVPAKWTRG